jgi:hypothetical protein
MRRVMLATAGLALMIGIGLTGVPGASGSTPALHVTATPALHVKPGSKWTLERVGGSCAVWTIGAGDTWTSDMGGNKGTFTGGGHKITATWTAGSNYPASFSGTYHRAAKEYVGPGGGNLSGGTFNLIKGVVPTWDGYSC